MEELLAAAIRRVQPAYCLGPHLPAPPKTGRVIVIGAGKASAAMAQALEQAWPDQPLAGLVICPYGSQLKTRKIQVTEAGHPMPDRNGVTASRRIVQLAEEAGAGDLVLALISGGGSALMTLPISDLSLTEYRQVNEALLKSGASIHEINTVRKQLSAVKGGRLADAVKPAQLVTLAISDVVGDRPDIIASGPTVPDDSSASDAIAILDRLSITLPATARHRLENTKPTEMGVEPVDFRLIAKPMDALQAAAEHARQAGLMIDILGDTMEGDAQDAGRHLADYALRKAKDGWHGVILSGGEVTTRLARAADPAEGGPNRETALSFAAHIAGHARISALFADTDGVDGKTPQDNPIAGAHVDGGTVKKAKEIGRSIEDDLAQHRSGDLFEAIGQSIRTGPTHTNVNDFRAILIEPENV